LSVPLPVLFIFYSATLFNINPDYEMRNITSESVLVIELEEYNFIYTNDTEAIYDGVVVYHEGEYGFYMNADDILKVEDGYFNNQLEDIKTLEIQKQTSYKIPLSFFISLFGVGIVFLIISGKMQLYKKYPRASVLIALFTGTAMLYVMNTIISNILAVFLIATASWAVYCIEYMVQMNKLSQEQADKKESDVISALKDALKY